MLFATTYEFDLTNRASTNPSGAATNFGFTMVYETKDNSGNINNFLHVLYQLTPGAKLIYDSDTRTARISAKASANVQGNTSFDQSFTNLITNGLVDINLAYNNVTANFDDDGNLFKLVTQDKTGATGINGGTFIHANTGVNETHTDKSNGRFSFKFIRQASGVFAGDGWLTAIGQITTQTGVQNLTFNGAPVAIRGDSHFNGSLTSTEIPEPSTYGLMAIGLLFTIFLFSGRREETSY